MLTVESYRSSSPLIHLSTVVYSRVLSGNTHWSISSRKGEKISIEWESIPWLGHLRPQTKKKYKRALLWAQLVSFALLSLLWPGTNRTVKKLMAVKSLRNQPRKISYNPSKLITLTLEFAFLIKSVNIKNRDFTPHFEQQRAGRSNRLLRPFTR